MDTWPKDIGVGKNLSAGNELIRSPNEFADLKIMTKERVDEYCMESMDWSCRNWQELD